MAADNDPAGAAEAGDTRILCLTGPESSGKTTLAIWLAERLGAQLVPEMARTYLAGRSVYEAADLLAIARLQIDAERKALRSAERLIVCDTDLTVIQVWWEERYRDLPAELSEALAARSERAYLLLEPDLPWEADALRENPHDRDRLFQLYRHLLDEGTHPYAVVGGAGELREQAALQAVVELFPELSLES